MSMERLFARRVRMQRTRFGWTQAGLAERVGELGLHLDPSAITRIESGDRAIRIDEAALLAEALATSLTDMLTDPRCERCFDSPPQGYTCNECGAS